jgi:hypothetical protein
LAGLFESGVNPLVDGLLQLVAQALLDDEGILVCGYVSGRGQAAGYVAVAG